MQGGAVEALVGDDQIAAAADHQQRGPGRVGRADRGDDLVVGRGREQPVGRSAETEGGEGRERGVVEFLHALKSTGAPPGVLAAAAPGVGNPGAGGPAGLRAVGPVWEP
ncbi:hypothetical protein GCM10010376_13380 [Streptomyces violaceusniger]